MRLLLQATATMGIASLLSILSKMVGAKIIASTLGPSGTGVYAQLVLIVDLATLLSSMGLGVGIVRYGSAFRAGEDWPRLRVLESTLLYAILPFSLLVGALGVVFSERLSLVLLGDASYGMAVALALAGMPLSTSAGLAAALTNVAKQFRYRGIAMAATSIAGVAFLAPLVATFGLTGAGLSLAALGAFEAAIAWFLVFRIPPRRALADRLAARHVDLRLLVGVLAFGASTLVSNAIIFSAALVVRTEITTALGTAANGLYQVVWAAQASWFGIAFSAFNSYFYPSYCEARDLADRRSQLNRILRFVILATTPCLGAFMLLRTEVVLALYTPEFLPAVPLLGVSILYGLFNVTLFCLNMTLLAAKRLTILVALHMFQQLIFVGGSHYLLQSLQLNGIVYAAAAASFLTTAISLIYTRRRLGLRLSGTNMKTLVLSIALIGAILALSELPRIAGIGASLVLLLVWAWLVLERAELIAVRELVASALERRGVLRAGAKITPP